MGDTGRQIYDTVRRVTKSDEVANNVTRRALDAFAANSYSDQYAVRTMTERGQLDDHATRAQAIVAVKIVGSMFTSRFYDDEKKGGAAPTSSGYRGPNGHDKRKRD